MNDISIEGSRILLSDAIIARAREVAPEALRYARESHRKRYAIPLFPQDSPFQALVNALTIGTYVPPHLHVEKKEYFVPIQGELGVVKFTYGGEISNIEHLLEDSIYSYVPPQIIHSAVPLTREAVVLEILNRPYDPETHKQFPDWAIRENDVRVPQFQRQLMEDVSQILNITLPIQ